MDLILIFFKLAQSNRKSQESCLLILIAINSFCSLTNTHTSRFWLLHLQDVDLTVYPKDRLDFFYHIRLVSNIIYLILDEHFLSDTGYTQDSWAETTDKPRKKQKAPRFSFLQSRAKDTYSPIMLSYWLERCQQRFLKIHYHRK